MKKTKVSIIGGGGYGAAEILRNLVTREDVDILRVSSKDYIGRPISKVHRALAGHDDIIIQDITPTECVEGADVVFLAMPHVITAKVALELLDLNVRIIDLSGDFRLQNIEDYQRDYAPKHPCPERLGSFVYGMPELNSEAIKSAKHVASPGCFATAISMGLLPLAASGLLNKSKISNVSMTGSSGSGVHPQLGTHHAIRANNLKAYKILTHQHTSEISQTLTSAGAENITLNFVPVSAPLVRGILAISQIDMPEGKTIDDIQKLYQDYYASSSLVSITDIGVSPEIVAVAGTARVEIGLSIKEDIHSGIKTLCCITAIDNLIKGGAGQAIQSFNLMTGKSQDFGLHNPGLWP
ncbi:N-acetyl-gamma-glutamyl-phosphate reductase [gamma proteobacterium IMCC1989]|nr:N-acetyl-gamma-glutamyl-phosphate reductase [gamma proteobacterium IMCC1989]